MIHLVVWPILVPLLSLPVSYLLCQLTACRYYSYYLAVSFLNFIPFGFLTWMIAAEGVITYELGGWIFERGIVLVLDPLSLLFLFLIQVHLFLAIIYSGASDYFDPRQFFVLLFIGQAGLSGLVLTGDLFNMYVFMEITAIVFYALVAFDRSPEGLEGGFKYLILGSVGGFFILWGIGLTYAVAGNLNLSHLAQAFVDIPAVIKVAILSLLTVGFALKFAVFPLHTWKTDAYGAAPPTVSSVLAGVGSKVPIYCLLRVYSLVFGWSYLMEVDLSLLLAGTGIVTIIVGHLMAMRQEKLGRLLSFSSVAHIGYIVVGISTVYQPAVEGSLLHVINHGVLKAGLFLLTGLILVRTGTEKIEELKGLHQKYPIIGIIFLILSLGMIGLPPSGGFLSKWQIVVNSMTAGHYISGFTVVLGGFLALFYYSRIMVKFFSPLPGESGLPTNENSSRTFYRMIPVLFLGTVSLFIFFAGNIFLEVTRLGAGVLFDISPYLQAVLGG